MRDRRGRHRRRRYPRALRERYALNVALKFMRLGESAEIAARKTRELSAAIDRARESLANLSIADWKLR